MDGMKIIILEQARIKALHKLAREESSIKLLMPLTDNARKSIEARLREIVEQKARLK